MSGKKIAVLTNMMNSVRWLDEESHSVKLKRGSIVEGSKNGNIDTPTLSTMQAMLSVLASMANHSRRRCKPSPANIAPSRPSAGTSHSAGCAM